jgi:hypothetical protein
MTIDPLDLLAPPPHRASRSAPCGRLPDVVEISVAVPLRDLPALHSLRSELAAWGRRVRLCPPGQPAWLRIRVEPPRSCLPEAYRLELDGTGAELTADDARGVRHGLATLRQWLRLHRAGHAGERENVLGLRVDDRPDLARRGVMLDVSRNKVPTLGTLCDIVELLAQWKLNELQLYTEHTFAYEGHEEVWRHSSPLTPSDISALDRLCRSHGIDLVPNQNSFGHMHRWLVHERYRSLAECPEGIEHPFSRSIEPFSLCPTDPGSLALLADLYGQLLPCFSSSLFNIGLDETLDLGRGRSAEQCEQRGRAAVYLGFLRQVHDLVRAHGKRAMYWADIVLEHPECVPDLPPDAIALIWGYEARHPFAEQSRLLAASGLDFYVCPGTSSWNSLAGRWDNARANLAAAATAAAQHGAGGYLITDWGDNGHLQPWPVSLPGLAAGACFAWNAESARRCEQLPVAEILNLGPLEDLAVGQIVEQLGLIHRHTGARLQNGTVPFRLLISAADPLAQRDLDQLEPSALEHTRGEAAKIRAHLASATATGPDSEVLRAELDWAARAVELACELGEERLRYGAVEGFAELPAEVRRSLAAAILALAERREAVWLLRNRSGGLEPSLSYLRDVAELLEPLQQTGGEGTGLKG